MLSEQRAVEILLVEDSEPDARLTQEALRESKILNNLHVARDGAEAMAFLRRHGQWGGAPRPDVMLMDLNMPRMDGHELLRAVKADESLKLIPVIILTSSSQEEDVPRSFQAHANAYVRKPLVAPDFFEILKAIEVFWFQIVTLPPSEDIPVEQSRQV